MTREEAVKKLLEEHCGYGDGDCDRCKFKCEIYMAIEALRLNPDAARESIDEVIKTAQQERPKGRWIEVYDLDYLKFIWSCDQCGEDAPTKAETCDQILKPFCPNCGADMKDGESND